VQHNLAITYECLGRLEQALQMKRDVYSGQLKLDGEEHYDTLLAANNYAASLVELERFKEAKKLMRKTMPVARRALSDEHDLTLNLRKVYAESLYLDASATRGDVAQAVAIYEDILPRVRRIFGKDHPNWRHFPKLLEGAREKLASFDT
jgi:tetratricopeptide (TPR) repeat protein